MSARGELDLSTQLKMATCVGDVLAVQPLHLVLDLTGLRFCAVAGLRLLIETRDRCAALHTRFDVLARRDVSRTLRIVGLHDLPVTEVPEGKSVSDYSFSPSPNPVTSNPFASAARLSSP
ncbi:STAS domain-containing protein [Amycolatopsis rubida]|uniref:STAS domain-containing protein n=1 Tax=Amycolatopsis rubida TaxID=112413 RepID=UPI003B8A6403